MLKTSVLVVALAALCICNDQSNDNARVIGGESARENQVPYQVSLRSASKSHFCGGAIITTKTILTAAHCVYGRSVANTMAAVGSSVLGSANNWFYNSSDIIIHELYHHPTMINDIALVITDRVITTYYAVLLIPISNLTIGPNEMLTFTGWGMDSYPGSTPQNLQIVNLTSVSVFDCQGRLENFGEVSENNLCTATRGGIGTCHGDTGGPLVSNGRLVGILSWFHRCADGFPDVHTRISSYYDWILNNQIKP